MSRVRNAALTECFDILSWVGKKRKAIAKARLGSPVLKRIILKFQVSFQVKLKCFVQT